MKKLLCWLGFHFVPIWFPYHDSLNGLLTSMRYGKCEWCKETVWK